MANTVQIWAKKMIAQKDAEADLIVDTNSSVGGWKISTDIVSFILRSLEKIFDSKKAEYEAKEAAVEIRTLSFYQALCLAYQEGDTLVFLGNKFGFHNIDTTKQIVGAVNIATHFASNRVGLKFHVTRLVGNDLTALTTAEETAFMLYLQEVKPCGNRWIINALAVGNFIVTATVYYDPAKFNADGSLFADPSSFPVTDALYLYQNEHVNVFQEFSANEVINRILAIDGVEDINFVNHKRDAAGGTSYSTSTSYKVALTQVYGYLHAGTPAITFTSI